MRKLLLVVTGLAAATLQLAHGQDDSTSRRNPDTELFFRGARPSDPHYARVDRFDEQLFETHRSPGDQDPGTIPDRWWTQ